jgi:hypothetical protein
VVDLAAAIALLVFLLAWSASFINSDSASTILLADQLAHAGRLVSRDWAYVSDSLGFDGRLQIAMLGALAFGPTTTTSVFSACLGAGFAFASSALLARLLGADWLQACSGALLLLLGPSLIYLDVVVGLGISVQMGLVCCYLALLVTFVFRRGHVATLLGALAVALLMTASSPKKALVYTLLPLLASGSLLALAGWAGSGLERARRSRLLLAMGLACATALLGWWLHVMLLRDVFVDTSYATLALALTPGRIATNSAKLVELAAHFAGSRHLLLPQAAVAITTMVWLLLLVAPVLDVRRRQLFSQGQGFVYLFALAGFGGIVVYLLTYENIKPFYGIYYALIPLSPLLPVAATVASRAEPAALRHAVRVALMLGLLPGIANVCALPSAGPSAYAGMSIKQRTTHRDQLAATHWLRQHGFDRGFATYWEANTITLLSGGAIQVTPIRTPAGGRLVRRMAWLADRDRVNYMPGNERWFILLPVRQHRATLPPSCLPAASEAIVAGNRLYTYERPMPGCLQKPVRFQPMKPRKNR